MDHSGPELDLLTPESIPDWDRIGFDALCPRCGYNLRTLSRPKCPECGLEFAWADVLRESGFKSEFLFEHHWRKKPFRSFFMTFVRSLRPKRFWSAVSIHDRLDTPGLLLYLLMVFPIFLLCFHSTALIIGYSLDWFVQPRQPNWSMTPFKIDLNYVLWEVTQMLKAIGGFQANPRIIEYIFYVVIVFAIPILAIFLLLASLHETLGRNKITRKQIFRVVAYAMPAVAAWGALLAIFCGLSEYLGMLFDYGGNTAEIACAIAFLLLSWVLISHFLAVGFRTYLHLPRPRILAYTVVFVGLLSDLTFVPLIARS
jgi:hypothetical protein